jgi:hypothetical protein
MNDLEEFELPASPASQLLAMIDAEQNQLLTALDDLNERIETLLRQCAPATIPTEDAPETTLPRVKAA